MRSYTKEPGNAVRNNKCNIINIMAGAKISGKIFIEKYCNANKIYDLLIHPVCVVLGVLALLLIFQMMYLVGLAKNYFFGSYDFSSLSWSIMGKGNGFQNEAMDLAFVDGFTTCAILAAVGCSLFFGKKLITHFCELGHNSSTTINH